MSSSPQLHTNTRIPRFRLTETTPAVLQFENGLRVAGELHVISCNGGLLLLPAPAHQGSVVGLMFHTQQRTGGGQSLAGQRLFHSSNVVATSGSVAIRLGRFRLQFC